jgi:hypothetical protein
VSRTASARLLLLATLSALLLAAVPGVAGAQSGEAMVRVAHFSPDAPNVDVYVGGAKALSDVPYKTVSDYLPLPAGKAELAVRPAGAAAGSKPVISATPTLEGGQAYTVAAVGKVDDIKGEIFTDDLSAPPSGQAKVRAIHAAPDVPAVDVAVKGGPTLFEGAEFPSATDYAPVPAGSYDLQVKAADGGKVLLEATAPVEAGKIYSIAAIGGAGKPVELLPIVDAAGMATMPDGGIATGAGGTAPGGSSSAPFLAVAALVLAMGAVGVVVARRRVS